MADADEIASSGEFDATSAVPPAAETGTEAHAFEEAARAVPSVPPPPHSWPKEVAEKHWPTLSEDAQGFISQREKQAHDAISRAGQRIRALERQAAWSKENPREAIQQLLQASGLRPEELFADHASAYDAKTRDSMKMEHRTTFESALNRLRRDNQTYAPIMGEIENKFLRLIMKVPEAKVDEDTLDTLFSIARDQIAKQTGFNTLLEQQREAERKKQETAEQTKRAEEMRRKVADAKRAAAVNVRSSPGAFTPPRTIDDTLREVARKHYG